MNTEPELREQDADLRRFVIDVSRTFGMVVCGYSGRDASVMEMFWKSASVADAWPQGFWWMVRSVAAVPSSVRDLLVELTSKGVAAHLVVAHSFDETMGAIARQAVVEPQMRRYLDELRPRGRVVAAALPKPSRKWPVLRFNALPIAAARIEVARVALPAGWRRSDARAALRPRPKWPLVVCGPGEVLALGDPDDARSQLVSAGVQRGLAAPGEAALEVIDPLAVEASPHHHRVLVQAIAKMLSETLPVRMQASKSGSARLIVEGPRQGEPSHFANVRKQLRIAYGDALYGDSPPRCGIKDGKRRRFAEEVGLDFDCQAGRAWLLFRLHTWVEPPQIPVADRELDPATPWVNERWALRRRNEFWAELIKVWSELIAPADHTVLTLAGRKGASEPMARVELCRINAFSRPN